MNEGIKSRSEVINMAQGGPKRSRMKRYALLSVEETIIDAYLLSLGSDGLLCVLSCIDSTVQYLVLNAFSKTPSVIAKFENFPYCSSQVLSHTGTTNLFTVLYVSGYYAPFIAF